MAGSSEAAAGFEASARLGGLHYVEDDAPGITREAVRDGFRYRDAGGRVIRASGEIARIRKLAIPPAYRDVWISPDPEGHLQATGRDARGRKQYRYHPRWREVRDEAKFGHMLVFGRQLPRIREAVERDLGASGLPRRKVVASVVRLLEKSLVRIGNAEYARDNRSFGLTTLRDRHVRVRGSRLTFDFRAKSGIAAHVELADRRLANLVRKLQDLPGQNLFQFEDDDGRHAVTSDDVNAYLREASGEAITAKDFRTWAATNLAALALAEFEAFDSEAKAKKNVLRTIEAVAKMLGNTPAICRKCYIHPAIFEGYLDGSLTERLAERAGQVLGDRESGLTAEEVAVTAFLSRRLEEKLAEAAPPKRARRRGKSSRGGSKRRSERSASVS